MPDQPYGNPVSPVLPESGGHASTSYGSLTTTPKPIKLAPGQLMRVYAFNTSPTPVFLQLFDTVYSSVTVGTTIPRDIIGIPANNWGGFTHHWMGDQYYNAISAAVSTTPTGSTSPTPVTASFSYH